MIIVMVAFFSCAPEDLDKDDSSIVEESGINIQTSMGSFTVELDFENAPLTSANFMDYIELGFYDGTDGQGTTIFHRVIDDFVIQGGGYTEDTSEKVTLDPIVNEGFASGLSNIRGSIAMARTDDPNSATSQFYINLVDNDFLDPTTENTGYAVFGMVTSGLEIVDSIGSTETDGLDQPLSNVIIQSISPNN